MDKEERKPREDFDDDGRTVASMDFDSLINNRYVGKKRVDYAQRRKELADLHLNPAEKWAIIKAVYSVLIPFILIMFASFVVVFYVIGFLWKLF